MTTWLVRCMPVLYFFAGIAATAAVLSDDYVTAVMITAVAIVLGLVVEDYRDRLRYRQEMTAAVAEARARTTI